MIWLLVIHIVIALVAFKLSMKMFRVDKEEFSNVGAIKFCIVILLPVFNLVLLYTLTVEYIEKYKNSKDWFLTKWLNRQIGRC